MTSEPEPDDAVPDFLVEKFETEPVPNLRAISVYVTDGSRRKAVPMYVRDAFTVQDEPVKQAVGEYAGDLAGYLESEGYETLEDVPKQEAPGDSMGSAFYNPKRGSGKDDDDDDDDGGLLGGLLGG